MASKSLSKSEIIAEVAKATSIDEKTVNEVVNSLLGRVVEHVVRGREVNLIGFGKFSTIRRRARNGVNPSTGAKIRIPAAKTPKFTAGKTFKDVVANPKSLKKAPAKKKAAAKKPAAKKAVAKKPAAKKAVAKKPAAKKAVAKKPAAKKKAVAKKPAAKKRTAKK